MAVMTIGDRIRMARESVGMTQAELAERLGVEPPSVSRWESGGYSPRPSRLAEMAKILGRPPDWFVGVPKDPSYDLEKRLADLEARFQKTSVLPVDLALALAEIPLDTLHALVAMYPAREGAIRAILGLEPNGKAKKGAG